MMRWFRVRRETWVSSIVGPKTKDRDMSVSVAFHVPWNQTTLIHNFYTTHPESSASYRIILSTMTSVYMHLSIMHTHLHLHTHPHTHTQTHTHTLDISSFQS